jgi:hypothetical protein
MKSSTSGSKRYIPLDIWRMTVSINFIRCEVALGGHVLLVQFALWSDGSLLSPYCCTLMMMLQKCGHIQIQQGYRAGKTRKVSL